MTRRELAELVREAGRSAEIEQPGAGIRDLLRALEREFLREDSEQVPAQTTLRSGAAARSGLTEHPSLATGNLVAIGVGTAWGEWMLWTELGPGGEDTLRRAYASGRVGTVELVIGRDAVRWGGSPRTTLFLDANAGSVDAFRLSVNWPDIRLAKVFALLSAVDARYLAGTRVDWQPAPRLRVGVIEMAVVRPGPLLPYWILNPFPAVLTGPAIVKLQDWTGADDNPLGGLDFDFLVWPGLALYGQIFADDLNWGHAPNRLGWQLGAFWEDPFRTGRTSLRIEYSTVVNWTYTSLTGSGNHFLFEGRPLGFWLGNDADDVYVEVSRVLSSDATLAGWLARSRHGEGRIGTIWTSAAEAFEKWWLSGVVETRYSLGLQYEVRSSAGSTTYWAEVGSVANLDNISGVTGWDYRLGIQVARKW